MGELLALQWRDVDFAGEAIRVRRSYNRYGGVGTPKSGKVRSVPLVADVAAALARLAERDEFTGEDDLVFPNPYGRFMDSTWLRDRYKAAVGRAGLRPLRFHDLRQMFGTLAVRRAEVPAVQAWMGHADNHTTMRYVYHLSEDVRQMSRTSCEMSRDVLEMSRSDMHRGGMCFSLRRLSRVVLSVRFGRDSKGFQRPSGPTARACLAAQRPVLRRDISRDILASTTCVQCATVCGQGMSWTSGCTSARGSVGNGRGGGGWQATFGAHRWGAWLSGWVGDSGRRSGRA